MKQVKLPFSIKQARAGETVIYADGTRPRCVLEIPCPAQAKIITVDASGHICTHTIEGKGSNSLHLLGIGYPATVDADTIHWEGGSKTIQQLCDEAFTVQGNVPDAYLAKGWDVERLHDIFPVYIELMRRHPFLINPNAKRIFFTEQNQES